jgi:hypothetical protein
MSPAFFEPFCCGVDEVQALKMHNRSGVFFKPND